MTALSYIVAQEILEIAGSYSRLDTVRAEVDPPSTGAFKAPSKMTKRKARTEARRIRSASLTWDHTPSHPIGIELVPPSAHSAVDRVLGGAFGATYEEQLGHSLAWVLQQDDVRALCAMEDGVVIGTVLLHSSDDSVFLNALAVLQDHRGRGIATQLLKAAVNLAAAEGQDWVMALVGRSDGAWIHRLYLTLGFELLSGSVINNHMLVGLNRPAAAVQGSARTAEVTSIVNALSHVPSASEVEEQGWLKALPIVEALHREAGTLSGNVRELQTTLDGFKQWALDALKASE